MILNVRPAVKFGINNMNVSNIRSGNEFQYVLYIFWLLLKLDQAPLALLKV